MILRNNTGIRRSIRVNQLFTSGSEIFKPKESRLLFKRFVMIKDGNKCQAKPSSVIKK